MKRVIRKNGNLLFDLGGREILPAAYMSYCPMDADYEGFYAIGYRLFGYCIYMGDETTSPDSGLTVPWEKSIWVSENTFDFSTLDKSLARFSEIAGDEDFYLMLRINLNVPHWWHEKYPDEVIRYKDGRIVMQSPASYKWREDACHFLDVLKKHIEEIGFSEHVIAWHLAAMSTEEWIHPRRVYSDLKADIPWQLYFQKFCEKKYGTIEKLNEAENTSYKAFSELRLPTCEEMTDKREHGKNARSYTLVRDAYEALNDCYADTITFFSRYVKKIFNDDIFVGVFYAEIGDLYDSDAHCETERLFREKSIDFFAAPFAYVKGRAMGVDWVYRYPAETANRYGKLFFMESDVRTNKTLPLADTRPDLVTKDNDYFNRPVFFGPPSEAQSVNNLVRSFSKMLISQHPYWWFDMWGGWYKTETFMNLQRRFYEIYSEKMKAEVQNTSEIALLLDEKSSYETDKVLQKKTVFEEICELSFIGAPYDVLLLNGLSEDVISSYKFFVFLNPVTESSDYKRIRDAILKTGKGMVVSGESCDATKLFLTREDFKEHAEKANVFLYSYGNIVYANDEYVSVTATGDAGEIKLQLPDDRALTNLLTGEKYVPKERTISLSAGFNDTYLLRRPKG